jgi:hypothetical protein
LTAPAPNDLAGPVTVRETDAVPRIDIRVKKSA